MHRILLALSLSLAACGNKTPTETVKEVQNVLPSAEQVFAAADAATYAEGYTWRPFRIISQGAMFGSSVVITAEILPNGQARMVTTMPGVGDIVQEFDGTHGWEFDPQGNVRLLEASELIDLRITTDPTLAMNYGRRYTDARVVGRETFDGQDCWVVEAKDLNGVSDAMLFAVDGGAEIGSRSTMEIVAGNPVPMVMTFRDHTELGGMSYPKTMITQLGEMSFTMMVTELTFDGPWDAVEANEEVQALLATPE